MSQTPYSDITATEEDGQDSTHHLAPAQHEHEKPSPYLSSVETHPLTPAMIAVLQATIARYHRWALYYFVGLPLICAMAFIIIIIDHRQRSPADFIVAAMLWGLIFYGAALMNLHLGRVGQDDLQQGTFVRVTGPLSARSLFWAGKDRKYRVHTIQGDIKTNAAVANCVDGLFGTIAYSPRLGMVFGVWNTKHEPLYLPQGYPAQWTT